MSVGQNIKRIRILRGMTQKELGLKIGLPFNSADVRIRQYESEKMVPKKDKLEAIANALKVDTSALKDHHINSDSDIMHALFEMENQFGLTINNDESGRIYLSFNQDHPLGKECYENLEHWYNVRNMLLSCTEGQPSDTEIKEYEIWKCQYTHTFNNSHD